MFTSDQRYRLTMLRDIPLPNHLPAEISEMVAAYIERLSQTALTLDGDAALQRLLAEIDGAVLASYALPIRLERDTRHFVPQVQTQHFGLCDYSAGLSSQFEHW